MFNATIAPLSALRAFAADHNIAIDGDRRRKQSYIDSITAWQAECGDFESVMTDEDFDDLLDLALSVNRGELTEEEAGITLTETTVEEDISLEELEAEQLPWEQPAASEVGFAPMLLLLVNLVLVMLALPVVLIGGLLKAIAFGLERLFDYLANPRRGGAVGFAQTLVLAIP